jgi:hypothetical protein
MVVNRLKLPESFVRFIHESEAGPWYPKVEVDAYGQPFDATDFEAFGRLEWIEQHTADLAQYFGVGHLPADEVQRWTEKERDSPGFIPYISDFSRIVQFGRSGSGEPFCFDYRENLKEPSVIHFDDRGSHWRRVAPNFRTFIALFEPRRPGRR